MAQELTKEQEKWVENLEKDYEFLPVGYAKALVELYVSNPDFFSKENIDKLRSEPAPKLKSQDGVCNILPGDHPDAHKFFDAPRVATVEPLVEA